MALITMPAGAVFPRTDWTPPAQNQVNRSGWTGGRKVVRLPGAPRWRVSAALKQISREVDAWPWKRFFTALEGEGNTFLMPFYCNPDAPAATALVRAGAVKGNETLPLSGLPVGLVLHGGQAISVVHPTGRHQLLMLTDDLVGAGDGTGTAQVRAALREAPVVGAVVQLRDPVCQMALTANVPLPRDEGVYNFAFDAEEAF